MFQIFLSKYLLRVFYRTSMFYRDFSFFLISPNFYCKILNFHKIFFPPRFRQYKTNLRPSFDAAPFVPYSHREQLSCYLFDFIDQISDTYEGQREIQSEVLK